MQVVYLCGNIDNSQENRCILQMLKWRFNTLDTLSSTQ